MVTFKATRWLTPSCLSALAGVGAALLFCNPAAAEACDDQGGCPRGFVCETREDIACPRVMCAPEDLECVKDAGVCDTRAVSECVPATCASDADCASDMVCFEESYKECDRPTAAAGTCREGEECKPVPSEEPSCEEKTRSSCVPRYVPPCTKDADCGPGFACTEIVEQSCSVSAGSAPRPGAGTGTGGSGGSEPSDAGVGEAGPDASAGEPSGDDPKAFAASEPSCTTKATGVFRCELQRVDCEAAADCPAGFTCEEVYARAACGSTNVAAPAPQDAGVAGGAESFRDGGSGGSGGAIPGAQPLPDDKALPADAPDAGEQPAPPDATCSDVPEKSVKVCMPPYAREQFARAGLHGDDAMLPDLDQASNTTGGAKDSGELAGEDPPTGPSLPTCSVSTPGAGAGGLLGFLGTLGMVAIVIARRSRRG